MISNDLHTDTYCRGKIHIYNTCIIEQCSYLLFSVHENIILISIYRAAFFSCRTRELCWPKQKIYKKSGEILLHLHVIGKHIETNSVCIIEATVSNFKIKNKVHV